LTTRRRALQTLAHGAGVAWAAAAGLAALPVAATPLAKVRERGSLSVAIYQDMPPFHQSGEGIDVEVARRLADHLGVRLALLPFHADENLNDDLRHMVWRGHYLGFGPADVMIHVPVDPPLMNANPRVQIFAPYYRERVVVARAVAKVPTLETMAALKGQPIAVAGQSLAGWLMLGADQGAYRDQLTTKLKDGTEAARLLMGGQVAAAAGHASELESVLDGDDRFVIDALPMPRAPREGWAVGLAVRKESTELAQALQAAMNELASSGQLRAVFQAGRVSWKPTQG
jgi:ABC-type amino acid transport substrate-binding protein